MRIESLGPIAFFLIFAAQGLAQPTRVDPPAAPGSLAPSLARVGDSIALTWLEPSSGHTSRAGAAGPHALRYARLAGGAWTPPATIAAGADFFLGWADVPSVLDQGGGRLLAHWSVQVGDQSTAIALARSQDGGKSWRRLAAEGTGPKPLERSFLTLLPDRGMLRAAWLEKQDKGDATSLKAGSISETLGGGEILDSRVCDCCQVSSAMTSDGPLVAYRDRSVGEIRDISVVRRAAKGWTPPASVARDDWKIEGCPVNGPAVAAAGRSVAVAWFTVAQDKPRVQVAFSSDSGTTFDNPILVDGARPLGRVGVALDDNGDAIVLWAATEGSSPTIRLRRASGSGRLGEPVIVAPTTVARTNGVPTLVKSGGTLAVSWLAHGKPNEIHVALMPAVAVR